MSEALVVLFRTHIRAPFETVHLLDLLLQIPKGSFHLFDLLLAGALFEFQGNDMMKFSLFSRRRVRPENPGHQRENQCYSQCDSLHDRHYAGKVR